MKNILIIIGLVSVWANAYSQTTSEFALHGRQLSLITKNASLEIIGTDDDKLVIESAVSEMLPEIPADAAGLQLISSAIKSENGSFTPQMVKYDDKLMVINIPESQCRHYRIKVPKGGHLKIAFDISSPYGKVSFTNLSGELEASGNAPVINFSYVTGPLTLSCGETGFSIGASTQINISHLQFKNTAYNKDTPFINIISSYADVNISLPNNIGASLQVDSQYGNLYSTLNFVTNLKMPPVKNRYYGLLNSGGRVLTINSTYGSIYIRGEKKL
ncbi:MAG: hypothetical protein V4456_06980 [Bacteroidota bacterium]